MSKADNLTDFMTDIANAIRTKKGISGTINPQNFSGEISGIETSSGESYVYEHLVSFSETSFGSASIKIITNSQEEISDVTSLVGIIRDGLYLGFKPSFDGGSQYMLTALFGYEDEELGSLSWVQLSDSDAIAACYVDNNSQTGSISPLSGITNIADTVTEITL